MKKIIVFFAIVVFGIVGCGTKTPAIQSYSIALPKVDVHQESKYKHKTIKVAYPQSIKEPLSEKMAFSYSPQDRGVYQNSQWSNHMGRILQGTLIEALNKSQIFKVALSDTSALREEYKLESNVFDFEHQIRDKSSLAILSIQFTLIDAGTGKLVKTKRFDYQESTPWVNAKGYAIATEKMIAQLTQDLLTWLQ
ncbi:MAG: hypothetical protein RLZZ428_570 [Pseudomonadota bacterium]